MLSFFFEKLTKTIAATEVEHTTMRTSLVCLFISTQVDLNSFKFLIWFKVDLNSQNYDNPMSVVEVL